MSESTLKSNSLKLRFESDSQEPTEPEIFDFMRRKMKLKTDDLLSMYKDRTDASIIIKFKDEEKYKATLARLPGTMEFVYNKYLSTQVHLSPACAVIKYARLFNLPPEIEDREIGPVLAKYGKVQRLVREKYGEDTGFPIWNSVRGAYIELKEGTEIPATLYIRNICTRVFYEGLINKCFLCGATDHVKLECPKRKTGNSRMENSGSVSYSDAVIGGPKRWITQKINSKTDVPKKVDLETVLPGGSSDKAKISETKAKKRQLSPTNQSSSDETETTETMETDDAKSKGDNNSSDSQQQQQKQQENKQDGDGDGDGWSVVPERKGRKEKTNKVVVRSSSVGASGSPEPFDRSRLRVPRKVRISEMQSIQNQLRIRSNAQKNGKTNQQNASSGPTDELAGTFLAQEFNDETL